MQLNTAHKIEIIQMWQLEEDKPSELHMAIKRRQHRQKETQRLKKQIKTRIKWKGGSSILTDLWNRQRKMATKQIYHHLKTNISTGKQKNAMQHEKQSCQQDQDIQFKTSNETVPCAQIRNILRKKTTKEMNYNFKTNVWHGIQKNAMQPWCSMIWNHINRSQTYNLI